tara:strand:+ start:235 stop:630 length:396 start_codon:yes stop_codon:yes gene_type:complete
MAHYAFINENNIVTEVIVGKDEDDNTDLPEGFADWEAWYADFRGQTCKRTSYNTIANTHTLDGTPFRGNYAGIGFTMIQTMMYFIHHNLMVAGHLHLTGYGKHLLLTQMMVMLTFGMRMRIKEITPKVGNS